MTQMAEQNRCFCNQSQLQTAELFQSDSGSLVSRHGCLSAVVGEPRPVCLPFTSNNKKGHKKVKGVKRNKDDPHSPKLASARMVPRPTKAANRRTHRFTSKERSAEATSFPSVSPEPSCAPPNCMEAVELSARSHGFYKAVAQ